MRILVLDIINSPFEEDKQLEHVKECLKRSGADISDFEFRENIIYKDSVDFELLKWADKVIAGGSMHSVYEDGLFWKDDLRRAYDQIIQREIPMHTICFGTQFLAFHLGEKVHKNPNGHEFGSVEIFLTDDGKKHEGINFIEGKLVHSTHSDCIEKVPKEANLLAFNENTEVQAFQFRNILATQFHTDLPTEAMERIMGMRKERDRINIRDAEHEREIFEGLKLGEGSWEILRKWASV